MVGNRSWPRRQATEAALGVCAFRHIPGVARVPSDPMTKTHVGLAAAALTAACMTVIPSAADAQASHRWDNCTNYNRAFHHGVGRVHAHDHTSGTPVTNFLHSNRKYRIAMRHNSDLDRDRDHIACEKA